MLDGCELPRVERDIEDEGEEKEKHRNRQRELYRRATGRFRTEIAPLHLIRVQDVAFIAVDPSLNIWKLSEYVIDAEESA